MNVLETIKQMIDTFEKVKSQTFQTNDSQDYFDREYNDLTHALEFKTFDIQRGYKLAKELQENRVNRRREKNLHEQLQPFAELLNKNHNFLKELKNMQAAIEIIVHTQQSRSYTPKARVDLFEEKGKGESA